MNDRDCENCIHHKLFSPDGINIVYGCEKWDCEYEERIDEYAREYGGMGE